MTLNKKQKRYILTYMLSPKETLELLKSVDTEYLCKKKFQIKNEDTNGCKELWVDNQFIIKLDFKKYPYLQYDLDHIDELDQCQWCGCWFEKDEMVYRRRGFTKLCKQCQSYLISRGDL